MRSAFREVAMVKLGSTQSTEWIGCSKRRLFNRFGLAIYTSNSKRIGLVKTWWDAKVAGEASSNASSNKFANANANGSENGNGNMGTEPISHTQGQTLEPPTFNMDMGQDLWDDGWWQDVFGTWGNQFDIMSAPAPVQF